MAAVKRAGLVILILVSVVLAILVGKRISPDAAAMLMGVAAGFVVSLPVMVIFALWAGRRREAEAQEQASASPPVIIVAPGNPPQTLPGGPPFPPGGTPTGGRHFVEDDWGYDDPQP